MNWIALQSEEQLNEIIKKSINKPQLIFKHSTRCPVSSMARTRLEKKEQPEGIDFYYLDLIKYRGLSNKVAEEFNVRHESPQVLLIESGNCTYHESHSGITMEDIVSEVK